MFDTILIDNKCPECHQMNYEGQTRILENNMSVYKVGGYVGKIYNYLPCFHICDRCGHKYKFKVQVNSKGIINE